MDKIVPIQFLYSRNLEAECLTYVGIRLTSGFYLQHQFAVLPYLVPQNSRVVYFPELPPEEISKFLDECKKTPVKVDPFPKELVEHAKALFTSSDTTMSEIIVRYKNEWERIEKPFWEFVSYIIPSYRNFMREFTVRVVRYGTVMGYGFGEDVRNPYCNIREDVNVSHIGEAILSHLVKSHENEYQIKLSWEGIESIVDFLMYRLVERGVFSEYQPTIRDLTPEDNALLLQSEKYLKKLGIFFHVPFVLHNKKIFFDNKNITSRLTANQYIVLSLFITKSEEIVTYDDLGDILWKEENSFSLWAINKLIQRLRDKLGSLGAPQECLMSVKGRGYTLINKS